ncbi:thioesterase II family protein [Marinactinospora thermotolerans]|uniref:Surfactin synthase thioesterase subunit n=1 Tax=Marinactinospora thermotolerans DSM 45154 TaxID=1122192 RepID=A0A1T4KMR3_9ACTN|nr:alpha/beta fold hydrolase [Marinactinospora thermotolerans]SJZ43732.1 Surfactin synthase thioesterase subunit [Marinactinospora thermotolerans DSM 45154]
MALTHDPWHSAGDASDPRLHLVCLPYAGSLAPPFLDWAALLPSGVELLSARPPGRGALRGGPAPATIPDVAEALVDPLLERLRGPFVLFGHSMGALIAFELARVFEDLDAGPRHLFVSSYRAPQLPMGRRQFHLAPDAELAAHLDVLSDGALGACPDSSLVPILRGDLRSCETYEFAGDPLLRTPVTAFHGAADPLFFAAEVRGWREVTRAAFEFVELPGGHFHLHATRREVLARILRAGDAPSGPPAGRRATPRVGEAMAPDRE